MLLGWIWLFVAFAWPGWRLWGAYAVLYVAVLTVLHAVILAGPAGLRTAEERAMSWLHWAQAETPVFLAFAAVAIVTLRLRLRFCVARQTER
jgi:hypothetical protein